MDISEREWKDALEPEDTELLAKLENKPYRAYELIDLIPKNDNMLILLVQTFAIQTRLNRLVKKGLVKSKDIRGATFYISSKAL